MFSRPQLLGAVWGRAADPKFIEAQVVVASPISARSELISTSDLPKHRLAGIGA